MKEKTKLWYLENFNLFKELDDESKKDLVKYLSDQVISKAQPIYFAHDPSNSIFMLKQGRVKITRTSSDGREMILAIINPGEIFGELAMIDDGERTDYAYSLDNSIICSINKEDFQKFVVKNPEINNKITRLIGFRLKKYTKRIEDLVFKDAGQRVISFILTLAEDQGKRIGGEIFIKPFLVHQDIAELTACSRQTVNSVLTDLRGRNFIYFDRKKLIIKKETELKKMLQ